MGIYRVRERADADLTEIFIYTSREFGAGQAKRYLHLLVDAFDLLATHPALGREYDWVSPGLWLFYPAESAHGVYYRHTTYGVEIVRVLHQSMDPGQHIDPI